MITEFHVQQLWNLMNGKPIARPARRKLEAEGHIKNGKPTQRAINDMVRLAPRSKWSPPKTAQVERAPGMPRYNRSAIATLVLATAALSKP